MKPSKRKKLDSYIKLFTLFERELKLSHKLYDNDYYYFNYIVSREYFSDKAKIKVILTIFRNPLWDIFQGEPYNLRQILESYCRYFSISDITIVKPYNFLIGERKSNPVMSGIAKIEDRVSFECFRGLETYFAV